RAGERERRGDLALRAPLAAGAAERPAEDDVEIRLHEVAALQVVALAVVDEEMRLVVHVEFGEDMPSALERLLPLRRAGDEPQLGEREFAGLLDVGIPDVEDR